MTDCGHSFGSYHVAHFENPNVTALHLRCGGGIIIGRSGRNMRLHFGALSRQELAVKRSGSLLREECSAGPLAIRGDFISHINKFFCEATWHKQRLAGQSRFDTAYSVRAGSALVSP
jgi:hypothetical protein